MASQDSRIQENRYRQDDWADDNRRDYAPRETYRGEDSRRYNSDRQDFQANPSDYGRSREFRPQEDYGRGGEPYGRRDILGRNQSGQDYGDRNRDQYEREQYGRRDNRDSDLSRSGYLQSNQGNWNPSAERDYNAGRLDRYNRFSSEWDRQDSFLFGAAERAREAQEFDRSGDYYRRDQQLRENHQGRGPKNYARSSERIRDDLNDRLTDDSYIDASNIEVHAENGEVTLNGSVENRDQRHRAEAIAEQVSGVNHVQNNLRVIARPAAHQGQHQNAEGSNPQAGNAQGNVAGGPPVLATSQKK